MAIAKVIEVLAEGDSVEGAMEAAVKDASKTVRNIRHVYLENLQGKVAGDKITTYRVNAKITFLIE
ncbi:MAG: dodecin family protein [Anaerolineae bacterium]